jgi:hypothetical protein
MIAEEWFVRLRLASAFGQQRMQELAVCGHSGHSRSFRPFPNSRTCGGVSSCRSRMRSVTVSRTRAPVKFHGQGSDPPPRYFVGGFPFGPSTSGEGEPLLTFCYVDDGGLSVSAFQTYLGQYRSLFRSLTGPARLVFISRWPRGGPSAGRRSMGV